MTKPSIFESDMKPLEAIKKWRVAYPALDFVLTTSDCREVIQGFLNNTLDETEMTTWANFMELADWVIYEAHNASEIADFLFEISSPEINGSVSENVTLKTYGKFKKLAEGREKGQNGCGAR